MVNQLKNDVNEKAETAMMPMMPKIKPLNACP